MMLVSEIRDINRSYGSSCVRNQGTLIVYHIGRLSLALYLTQRTALPRPSAKGSISRPLRCNQRFNSSLFQDFKHRSGAKKYNQASQLGLVVFMSRIGSLKWSNSKKGFFRSVFKRRFMITEGGIQIPSLADK